MAGRAATLLLLWKNTRGGRGRYCPGKRDTCARRRLEKWRGSPTRCCSSCRAGRCAGRAGRRGAARARRRGGGQLAACYIVRPIARAGGRNRPSVSSSAKSQVVEVGKTRIFTSLINYKSAHYNLAGGRPAASAPGRPPRRWAAPGAYQWPPARPRGGSPPGSR